MPGFFVSGDANTRTQNASLTAMAAKPHAKDREG
jgi:hypothetical protein